MIVELDPAEAAVIEISAGQRLQEADRRSDQLVDFVESLSFLDFFRSATGAFGVSTKVIEEIPLRANTRITPFAFENHGINGLFPKSATRSCEVFVALNTLPHTAFPS
jgi:hypothetical protein